MINKDSNAKTVREQHGSSLFPRWVYHFESGDYRSPDWDETTYQSFLKTQENTPVVVGKKDRRVWWMFRRNFYCEEEGHSADEVKALVTGNAQGTPKPDVPPIAPKMKQSEASTSVPGLQAKGINGQIELYPNKVCIRRQGFNAFVSQGFKGDKDIMISSITSIQFKKTSMWANGYIQFAFMGGQEAQGGLFQATRDENTVMFNPEQQADFERIKNELEKRIQRQSATTTASSDADEITKLADLRDKGILTDQEFQQKKKQILGL